jgi:hypothetical protein
MDRYFKNAPQKFEHEFTKLGPAVCVLGRSGIGKTWTVFGALHPHVELTAEILRSKQDTIDFLQKIRGTKTHVIIDEYECLQDLVGLREITGPPTNGLFVVISQIPVKFDFKIETYEFPVPDAAAIKRIVPDATDEAIAKSKGDLRFVIQSLTFKSDDKDEFQGARDFIETIVSSQSRIRPAEFLGHSIHEPGNVTAILHENYVDSKKCNHAEVIRHMSDAVLMENKIYDGNWFLYPYYNLLGCVLPATELGHTLRPPLRPGSVWTKHQSACARQKRLEAIAQRVPGKRLSMEEILMLRDYAEKGDVEILKEYQLKPQDLDALNHLVYDLPTSTRRKIKPKNIAALKKSLT